MLGFSQGLLFAATVLVALAWSLYTLAFIASYNAKKVRREKVSVAASQSEYGSAPSRVLPNSSGDGDNEARPGTSAAGLSRWRADCRGWCC